MHSIDLLDLELALTGLITLALCSLVSWWQMSSPKGRDVLVSDPGVWDLPVVAHQKMFGSHCLAPAARCLKRFFQLSLGKTFQKPHHKKKFSPDLEWLFLPNLRWLLILCFSILHVCPFAVIYLLVELSKKASLEGKSWPFPCLCALALGEVLLLVLFHCPCYDRNEELLRSNKRALYNYRVRFAKQFTMSLGLGSKLWVIKFSFPWNHWMFTI